MPSGSPPHDDEVPHDPEAPLDDATPHRDHQAPRDLDRRHDDETPRQGDAPDDGDGTAYEALDPGTRRDVLRQALSVGIATGAYGISFGALGVA